MPVAVATNRQCTFAWQRTRDSFEERVWADPVPFGCFLLTDAASRISNGWFILITPAEFRSDDPFRQQLYESSESFDRNRLERACRASPVELHSRHYS